VACSNRIVAMNTNFSRLPSRYLTFRDDAYQLELIARVPQHRPAIIDATELLRYEILATTYVLLISLTARPLSGPSLDPAE
jgi:hypothetical protein